MNQTGLKLTKIHMPLPPKCKAVIIEDWRHQDIGDSRAVGYLLKRAAKREWNQPKRKKCVAVNKAKRSWRSEECFDISYGDAEFGVCPVCLTLVQYFLTMLRSLPFGIVVYILCHYMLEVCDLVFILIL